jgi:glycosyltransferase involved in cell wall biosynthesis
MKILHINQSDIEGGASIAGYRLHEGLLAQGINSQLLVNTKKTKSHLVTATKNYQIEKLTYRLGLRTGLNNINTLSSFGLSDLPVYQQADILNFHNLHGGYFNYLALPKITATKTAVWTLHDMWSFTGHCAYSYDCSKWQTGCGQCPYPDIYPPIERDNTKLEWKLKNWTYDRSNLAIVAPSHWLTQQARQSMLDRFPIHHIPYGIDLDSYQPLDPDQCRSVLGIPQDKHVLMCGAVDLLDTRKGGDLLHKTLQSLPESLKADCLLLMLGNGGEVLAKAVGMQSLELGYVVNDRLKAIAYSAADLFLFPTRADNLPLVLQESMACGTPMVSFKIGGVPDLVRPNQTGYLAAPEDIDDFRQGMIQLLEDRTLRQQMRQQCRDIAVAEYPLELQAKRYLKLYAELLAKS